MSKATIPENAGRVILKIFRCNGVQPGGMMLFPALSAQFIQGNWHGRPEPPPADPGRLGDHHWSQLHTRFPEWQGADLAEGISYLMERGYLQQGTDNRIAYFLTDSGFAASCNPE